jgi:hypothetical protein
MEWLRNVGHKLLQVTHGRSTAFFMAFFVTGNIFAWVGKLSPVYIGFMGTLGGLVLGHSIKEDWAANINGERPPGGPDVDPHQSPS